MAIEGWYYLHQNGQLIYKREIGGTVADLRESDFVRGIWPFDPTDRNGAWRIVVEAMAAGADKSRVYELADKWMCTAQDAEHYAKHLGFRIFRDGNQWCATRSDFVNLQESPAGFGECCVSAIAALAIELGYKPSKMWGTDLAKLVTMGAQPAV